MEQQPPSETPPDPRTELLADLDARISPGRPPKADRPGNEPTTDAPQGLHVRPEQVDLVLRLHQLGAEWRARGGQRTDAARPRIGRFEIVRQVGQGGFAKVYEALDTLLGRRVALKVAHVDAILSPTMGRRFLREAELAARLAHPNLVTIHDLGEADGLTFIAEEFCDGGTLAAWLERHPGPVEPRRAAAIVKAVAEGLDAAHQRGIIHRDIKPENILLAAATDGGLLPAEGAGAELAAGAGWTVKLGDFGLGAIDDDGPDALSRLTRAGASLGTPAWMAPEQIDRTLGPIGPATDVHALGLLLDRLLVGRCRWAGKTDSETMRLILLRDDESVDRAVAGEPRDLMAVCRKCLAHGPQGRYPHAGALAADLGRFLLGVPTHARPRSPWQRAGALAVRQRGRLASAAAVLLAVGIAAVAIRGWSLQASTATRQQASLRRIDAALELQRGLADLAAGNSAGARDRITAITALDPALAASFAGRYARRRLRTEREILFGDVAAVADRSGPPRDLYCCAVSTDGARIAVGAADGRLILLDAERTAAPVVVASAHDEINDVAFSPDGRLVATAGQDGRVRLFDAATGVLIREVAAEPKPLFAVGFAPDGTRLGWAGAERVLAIGALDGGQTVRFPVPLTIEPGAEGSDVETVLFTDDRTVAIAGGAEVMLLSVADGAVIRRFVGHEGSVGSIDLSPDRTRLVTAGTDRTPRVWDLATARLLAILPRHPHWVQGCVFSADGGRIVTGCRDGVLQVFDAETGMFRERLPGHVGRTWDVRRETGGTVLSTGADGTLRRWSTEDLEGFAGARESAVATGPVVKVLPVAADEPGARDGTATAQRLEVIVVGKGGGALVVDPTTGRERARLTHAPRAELVDAAIDGPRHRLAIASSAGPAAVVSMDGSPDGERVVHATGHRLAWTASGRLVTASREADGVVVGRGDSLGDEVEIDRLGQVCHAVAVSPDGGTVAAGGLALLHLTPIARQGLPRAVGSSRSIGIDASFGGVAVIAWAPDGKRLAIGSTSGNVRILDALGGQTLQVLSGHRSGVVALAWSADGRVVISADSESLRVTDSLTAVPIDFFTPGWSIRSVALPGLPASPDRWLVIGGEAAEARPSADGVPGRGRLLVVDLGE